MVNVYEVESKVDLSWMEQFALSLRVQGKSARTVDAYASDVRAFARWFEDANGVPLSPDLITGVDLRAYRQWAVEGHHMRPASWNRKRQTLRELCRWAQSQGFLTYDPFQGVEEWRQEELPPRWLEKGEFQRFMRIVERAVNAARSQSEQRQAVRDQAMISLMIYAGLREGEVCSLDLGDVEIRERSGRVKVWTGKGDKKREVPLNAEARRAVGEWLKVRGDLGGRLFTGKGSEGMTARTVQRRVAEVGRLAGLVVTPHDLRHTCAKRLLDGGAPLTVVQKILGHARIETTARYVQPGWGDLERAVEGY